MSDNSNSFISFRIEDKPTNHNDLSIHVPTNSDEKEENNISVSHIKYKPQNPTRRKNNFFLSEEYSQNYLNKVYDYLKMTQFSIIKDDIRNYNILTEFQIGYLINLNEDEKIEIIKLYNTMIKTIEHLHN